MGYWVFFVASLCSRHKRGTNPNQSCPWQTQPHGWEELTMGALEANDTIILLRWDTDKLWQVFKPGWERGGCLIRSAEHWVSLMDHAGWLGEIIRVFAVISSPPTALKTPPGWLNMFLHIAASLLLFWVILSTPIFIYHGWMAHHSPIRSSNSRTTHVSALQTALCSSAHH